MAFEDKEQISNPVEKFSPPSETAESRSRNTLASEEFSELAGVASGGIR